MIVASVIFWVLLPLRQTETIGFRNFSFFSPHPSLLPPSNDIPPTFQVQSLTLQPKVSEGVITYEDSPLVRAVRHGHVLVVDEADKAPTNVTCVLKTLVESGTMTLGDGRRIISKAEADGKKQLGKDEIVAHPEFRMMVS